MTSSKKRSRGCAVCDLEHTRSEPMLALDPNATENNGEWSDGVCHVECWIADDAAPLLHRQIHLEKRMRGGCRSRPGRIWAMDRSLFETLRKIVDDRTMVLVGSTPEGPYRINTPPQGFDDLDDEMPF